MHTRDPSTVGNDTLTTPVLLVTIATNSRKARFSIGTSDWYIGEAIQSTSQSSSVSPRSEKLEVINGRNEIIGTIQRDREKCLL
jgi:hypothetical protein